MLVLSRRKNDSVIVYLTGPGGPTVTVRVIEVDRGKVRLGFDCPRDMAIVRGELTYHRSAALAAAGGAAPAVPVAPAQPTMGVRE
jgi:carbon storage regulator CsrA